MIALPLFEGIKEGCPDLLKEMRDDLISQRRSSSGDFCMDIDEEQHSFVDIWVNLGGPIGGRKPLRGGDTVVYDS